MNEGDLTAQIEYYMNLPYTIELIPADDSGWYAGIKELPGCMTYVDGDANEAVDMIYKAMRVWIEAALDDAIIIPTPGQV